MASEQGGYFRTCCDLILGNVARYPAEIALAILWIVGENRESWYNLIRSAMDGFSMTVFSY